MQFNPKEDSVRQRLVQNDIVNLILQLRKITCMVVQAIISWGDAMGPPYGVPFIWHGIEYMVKMRADLAFLQVPTVFLPNVCFHANLCSWLRWGSQGNDARWVRFS